MPTNDEEPQRGDVIDTKYGRGRLIDVTPSEITVWIVGRGTFKIPRATPRSPAGILSRVRALVSKTPAPREDAPSPAPPVQAEEEPVPVPPADDPERTRALAAIEALRLGTVPRFALREATIGRKEQIAQLARALDATSKTAEGRVLLVTGPNGAGKTHLLPFVEEEALTRVFVVARAELEGALKIAPKMVYQHLVSHLVWSRSGERHEGPLEEFLQDHSEDMDRVRVEALDGSPLLQKLVRDIRHGVTVPDAVWDWAHGDEVFAQTLARTGYKTGWLKEAGTHGQTLSNPMGALAHVARDLGYAGLVILLDEAELVLLQDARWAIMSREWLRGLVLAAEGGRYPSPAGEFAEEDMRPYLNWNQWGGKVLYQSITEYRLRYGGVDPGFPDGTLFSHARSYLRHAPTGKTPLVLVLGYTDQNNHGENVFNEQDDFSEAWLPSQTIQHGLVRLPEMQKRDVEELIERLSDLYARAHPLDAPRLRDRLPPIKDPLVRQIATHLRIGSVESIRGASQIILDVLDRIATGESPDRIRKILEGRA